jgi:hypothetical protein
MKRLTFRRGNILQARFAPDGQTVVYGAAWEGKPSELFSVRTDSVESRPLGLDHANVLSVSSTGELAVLLRKGSFQFGGPGILARVPLGGGAARELQDRVISAAWAPDGENLAVMSLGSGKGRLEYRPGDRRRIVLRECRRGLRRRGCLAGQTPTAVHHLGSDRQGRKRRSSRA